MASRNSWTDAIRLWGQLAIDHKAIPLHDKDRKNLFEAVVDSLQAKENDVEVEFEDLSSIRRPTLVLLPLSGGLDSLVAYHRAIDAGYEVHAYYVLLKTPYAKVEYQVCKKLKLPFEVIDYGNWPSRWKPYETSWKHILPLRNLLIITAIAELNGDRPGEIWLGATDGEIPVAGGDKSLKFFKATDRILQTMPVKHSLRFPLRHETKTELVRWWLESDKDVNVLLSTITCQSPIDGVACGACHACFNRWVALTNNGLSEKLVNDPKKIPANAAKVRQFQEALSKSDFSTWSQRRMLQTIEAWNRKL